MPYLNISLLHRPPRNAPRPSFCGSSCCCFYYSVGLIILLSLPDPDSLEPTVFSSEKHDPGRSRASVLSYYQAQCLWFYFYFNKRRRLFGIQPGVAEPNNCIWSLSKNLNNRINEELFFQNALNTISENELAMPMPSSNIVFWERAFHIYTYKYVHHFEEFFSKRWSPNLAFTLRHRIRDWRLPHLGKELFKYIPWNDPKWAGNFTLLPPWKRARIQFPRSPWTCPAREETLDTPM